MTWLQLMTSKSPLTLRPWDGLVPHQRGEWAAQSGVPQVSTSWVETLQGASQVSLHPPSWPPPPSLGQVSYFGLGLLGPLGMGTRICVPRPQPPSGGSPAPAWPPCSGHKQLAGLSHVFSGRCWWGDTSQVRARQPQEGTTGHLSRTWRGLPVTRLPAGGSGHHQHPQLFIRPEGNRLFWGARIKHSNTWQSLHGPSTAQRQTPGSQGPQPRPSLSLSLAGTKCEGPVSPQ